MPALDDVKRGLHIKGVRKCTEYESGDTAISSAILRDAVETGITQEILVPSIRAALL